MAVCRKCGSELVEGDNWYVSYARKHDYICITCKRALRLQRHQEQKAKLEGLGIVLKCRECGIKLTEGENWWRSCAKAGDYICNKCHKASARQYRKEHKEEKAAYDHQYYLEYKEQIADYKRQWCQENQEKLRVKRRQYYEENKERILTQQREYRQEHLEERRNYDRQYYQEHSKEIISYVYQWKLDNPDKRSEYQRRRRARKAGAAIGKVDAEAIYERYGYRCMYCGSKQDLTLDHIVPLDEGGAHTEDNLVAACSSCNASKHTKQLMEWLRMQPYSQAWLM